MFQIIKLLVENYLLNQQIKRLELRLDALYYCTVHDLTVCYIFEMLNSKVITRKRSEQVLPSRQVLEVKALKKKKSTSNLHPSKTKRQSEKQFKNGPDRVLVHSHSKGKLKSQKHKNDENFNTINEPKSIEKITHVKSQKEGHLVSDTSKQKQREKNFCKTSSTATLTKSKSLSKLKGHKKVIKNESSVKQCVDLKSKRSTKKINSTQKNHFQSKVSLPSKGSVLIGNKSKHRKNTGLKNNISKTKIKKNKISEIIQKSILYSEVNYDFKEQISFLGSGIKEAEQFFLPYPLESPYDSQSIKEPTEASKRQNQAATTIQKNFRGYIQRKYIQEAQYIIKCIKTIQKAWRNYKQKKQTRKSTQRVEHKSDNTGLDLEKPITNRIGEASASLITIKDLNDTLINRSDNKKTLLSELNTFRRDSKETTLNGTNKVNLKEIIKNLLEEEGLSEAIKDKIRSAIGPSEQSNLGITDSKKTVLYSSPPSRAKSSQKRDDNLDESQEQSSLSQISQVKHSQQELEEHLIVKTIVKQEIEGETPAIISRSPELQQNQAESNQIAQKELIYGEDSEPESFPFDQSREIYLQREIESENKFFKSPMRQSPHHGMLSPAVGSITSPKCLSSSFHKDSKSKSAYNRYFKSNKPVSAAIKSPMKSPCQSAQKSARQSSSPRLFQELEEKLEKENNPNGQNSEIIDRASCKKNIFKLQKQDYLKSPQTKCEKGFSSPASERNAMLPEEQRGIKIQMLGFATDFAFVEQFCLIITDYIRQDKDAVEAFVEKLHILRYFKIEQIMEPEWRGLEFGDFEGSDKMFEELLMSTDSCPSVFNRTEKKMIEEFNPMRIFLHESEYQDSEIYTNEVETPQSAYLKLVFDVFSEAICENFAQCHLTALSMSMKRLNESNFDYLNRIVSNALGTIMKHDTLSYGTIPSEAMTTEEKDELKIVNEIRIDEMPDETVIGTEPIETLLKFKLGEGILDILVDQATQQIMAAM